jgi:hypothetical protein
VKEAKRELAALNGKMSHEVRALLQTYNIVALKDYAETLKKA